MLSEIMTQLLLLATVLSLVGGLIAFVMTFPARIKSTALELGAKLDRLSDAIDNLRRCHERLEEKQADFEERVRDLEREKGRVNR